jgi:hypothetical protein
MTSLPFAIARHERDVMSLIFVRQSSSSVPARSMTTTAGFQSRNIRVELLQDAGAQQIEMLATRSALRIRIRIRIVHKLTTKRRCFPFAILLSTLRSVRTQVRSSCPQNRDSVNSPLSSIKRLSHARSAAFIHQHSRTTTMALRNLFRGGHDDGQYGRDPWDRNFGAGDWEHLSEERSFGGSAVADREHGQRRPSDWSRAPAALERTGGHYRADRNELGAGFERRGWRPGSDYYGNNPERYEAGYCDVVASGAGRYGAREYIGWQDSNAGGQGNIGEFGQFRGRGPKGYRRSDERIREDVCECLTADEHIDASHIDVTVSDCEVTLSGTVSSREAKRRAEELIERISGVKDVSNSLRVVGQSIQEKESTADGSE